jgi:putative PIN family toxin of toxin-antitoxin system
VGSPRHGQGEKVTAPPRAVLDTNAVLSALIFAGGRLAPLRIAWQQGRCLPLVSKATTEELVRALGYPKFKLDGAAQKELLGDYLPYCEVVPMVGKPPKTPACRDPSDLPFLQLAVAGKADFLVTGDRDLLDVAGKMSCPVIAPEEFLSLLSAQ